MADPRAGLAPPALKKFPGTGQEDEEERKCLSSCNQIGSGFCWVEEFSFSCSLGEEVAWDAVAATAPTRTMPTVRKPRPGNRARRTLPSGEEVVVKRDEAVNDLAGYKW